MKTVIIQGSARSTGNTNIIAQLLQSKLDCDIIDLEDYVIKQYDYEYMNTDDDFMPLMRRIVDEYELLIFATPVYWYSMSGIMKAFFDRISDCLDIDKDTGRKLRGKSMALISVSEDAERFECLVEPFRLSAGYLGMKWRGDIHTWITKAGVPDEVKERVEDFGEQLKGKFIPIQYQKGDATKPVLKGNKIIAHICNDRGGWGKGFVMAISKRWKGPEEAYRRWHSDKEDFDLGAVQFVQVEEHLWIANLIGQEGMGRDAQGNPPIRYEAIRAGLAKVATKANELHASIHMPRIGCGLAGGKWAQVEPLIIDELSSKEIVVTVYDFE